MTPVSSARLSVACAALFVTACASRGTTPPAAPSGPGLPAALTANARHELRTFGAKSPQAGTIQHVVIVMEENRSFNYLFKGYKGATTASFGYNSTHQKIKLQPISMTAPYDIDHESWTMFAACDGNPPGQNCKMDGFDQEYIGGQHGPNPEYGYAPRSQTKIYWDMAKQYVLGDNMHTSHLDASFVSHQYIIAGQAASEVNLPTGNWGCGGSGDTIGTLKQDRSMGPTQSPCQDYQTLGDELDHAALPWRFYAASTSDVGYIWSAYQAVNHIYYGKDWTHDVITPSSKFLTDVAGGTLSAVTWVLPSWSNSDHSGNGSTTGPQWVASVVNAVGQSQFWDSTAIFVFWDEWGGWYDPVPPPYVDYDGLGFRVGLLVISPYAKRNYVSHVQYEHGSLLRFAENAFGLPQLSAADTRANDPAVDCFDFTKPARRFKPFTTGLPQHYFESQPPSMHPIDQE
jgi:phospholipase C